MKKKLTAIGLVVFLLLLGTIGVLLYHGHRYTYINGTQVSRSVEILQISVNSPKDLRRLEKLTSLKQLDLGDSHLSTVQYDELSRALPGCAITWSVPFQGGLVPSDITELEITSLEDADIPLLAYFPQLRSVSADGCEDFDQLQTLAESYPQLTLSYTVPLDGARWSNHATTLMLTTVTAEELASALNYLPQVTEITFREAMDMDSFLQLQQVCPDVELVGTLNICGTQVRSDATEFSLADIPLESTEPLDKAVRCMPNLKKVDMCGCGISNEEMDALNKRHEGVQFVWTVQIGKLAVRTDAQTFMPIREGAHVSGDDCSDLRYCTEMIAVDVGHMKITNCEFLAYMPHLKYLILADTHITDFSPLASLKELIFLEMFLTWPEDYTPLLSLTALEDLNIGYTFGGENRKCLGEMTWLKHLWWSGSADSNPYLEERLTDTELMFRKEGSSTGSGWRQLDNYYDMRDIFGMPYFVD